MIEDTLKSAKDVLKPYGSMRFSTGGGMPAVARFESTSGGYGALKKIWLEKYYPDYVGFTRMKGFTSDPEFGLSSYKPLRNGGRPMITPGLNDIYWYIFMRGQ